MADEKRIWVEAIPYKGGMEDRQVVGYHNHKRIKVGQRFQIFEREFSKNWMQRVSEKKAREAHEEERDIKADRNRRKAELEESVI